jgi:glycosyltransferase involved in cell wall biosynthesis
MIANSPPFPPTNGSKMRIWALLNCLFAEGCCTDLVCFGDPAEVNRHREHLVRFCRNVDVIPHKTASLSGATNVRGRIAALLSKHPYDVTTSRSEPMRARIEILLGGSVYDMVLLEETNLLANLPSQLSVPLVVDHQNAEHLLLERYVAHAENPLRALYAWLEARKVRHWEREATRRASAALVCSDHDRSIFLKLAPGTAIHVAPNVIDANAYAPVFDVGEENYTVLYAGGMDWYPNRDAVRYFAHRILPHLRTLVPETEFVVAGRAPSPQFKQEFARIPGIRFTGTLADLRPEIAKAAVCAVPLRIGSGTRLKILEAAAMGKAIVSTRIGAEGLEFVNGEEFVLADAGEFAEAVASLLADRNLRSRLGHAARKRLEMNYSLPAMRAVVEGLCRSITPRAGQ